ncbi:MAG: hypothetical protein P8M10_04505 [Ilumatobacter sp.]|nr:hypothetical protein [Ilumatobacter sp.]MDG1696481.1 hypothetical protein [Ilumatobacter sp.]MDG2438556.1 hypothetical protein [Ilumatobacter sp.]
MRSQIANIAEKFNEQVIGQLNQAGKTYTKTNDRMLDAIVDTNRKAVDFVVKTADQAPHIGLTFEVPMVDRVEFPTPADAGKRYLDAIERLAEINRDVSERMVSSFPADKPAVEAAVPAAKTAAVQKPTAKKPATKKASARKAASKK